MDRSYSWDQSAPLRKKKLPAGIGNATGKAPPDPEADDGPGCFCCDSDSDDSAEQIRVRNTNRKCARGCVNNLVICTIVIAYTFFGAVLFLLIEGGGVFNVDDKILDPDSSTEDESFLNDEKISAVKKNLSPSFNNLTLQWIDKINADNREKTVENIWDITVNLNILYRENWTRLAAQEINRFQKQLVERITREVSSSSSDFFIESGIGGTGPELPADVVSRHLVDSSTYQTNQHPLEWTLAKAFLFSLTIITTIGKSQ